MKIESQYINPISFKQANATELEAGMYQSCGATPQYFLRSDYLKWYIDFERSGSTVLTVYLNGVSYYTITLSTAAYQTFGGYGINGYCSFNKGQINFYRLISDFLPSAGSFTFEIRLTSGTDTCSLYSEICYITTETMMLLQYTDSRKYTNDATLFSIRIPGKWYDTNFSSDITVFKGYTGNVDLVKSKIDEVYKLSIGGYQLISLDFERRLRHIFGCNVKLIDGVEYEFTEDVSIDTTKFFRKQGRELVIELQKKYYTDVYSVKIDKIGTVINKPIVLKYDETAVTLAITPNELTTVTTTDSKTQLTRSIITEPTSLKIDVGKNTERTERTVTINIVSANKSESVVITQRANVLDMDDMVLGKNYILRDRPLAD